MRAQILWRTREEGGRANPPIGEDAPPYATIVRFTDINEPWPQDVVWTLVVEKIKSSMDGAEWLANVSFLAPNAPADALRPSRAFELYEGARCVASGVLMAD